MTDAVSAFLLPNLVLTAGILAVLVLRKPVRAQFGARMAYALWLLPVLALAASLLPPRVIETTQSLPTFEAIASGPEYLLPAAPAEPAAPVFTPALEPAFDPLLAALLLWIAGALAMFAWLGRRQALFMTDVRDGKAGPAVVGVIRPRIITPADFDMRFDESEQRVILAHETIHLARQDARINALVALIRCICWYNPLVHIGAHAMRIDQELACDAAVVERHPKARRLYADALLKAQLAARPLPLGCYWPAGTEHPLMERIEMLKQSAPGQLRRIAGAALLVTLTAAAATAAWAAMPPTTRVVYEDPQQSPAPPTAQKMDFGWENTVRIQGNVVAVNLDGAPPTVQVQGKQVNADGDQPEQRWTIDLTSKGRAPTQDRDLTAAKIGALVDVYAYRVDRTCKSNCLLWGRNFNPVRPPAIPYNPISSRGFPDRYSNDVKAMIRVVGKVASVVKSGSDNIITVRSATVTRGWPGSATAAETADWRFTQFNGVDFNRNPFNSPSAVGVQVTATGLPEKNTDCSSPCELAFMGANLALEPDGRVVDTSALLSNRTYDPAIMGPPADRSRDAPNPVAQPGFNAEDYVVVRGTVVRVEGGNPVKTFWVKAAEINRNFEKTQANTDTWRVDRLVPPGGAAPAEVRTGMSIRVDGYVSTSCQPECRIQPMLIDLVQQQAAVEPQTAAAQPIRLDQQPAPAKPRFQPSTGPFAVTIKGTIQRIELQNPNSYVWVQAEEINANKPGRTQPEAANQLYRVIAGPKDKAPEWAARQDSIGARITVIGYETSDAPCGGTCDLGGFFLTLIRPASSPLEQPKFCTYGPWAPPGSWGDCKPTGAATSTQQPIRFDQQADPFRLPPDFIPFAKYFDAEKPITLKGKVTGKDLFDGKAVMLWVEGVATSADANKKELTPDTRRWRVVLGAASRTPAEIIDKLMGQEIIVRGYLAKDTRCDPACLMNGRDITLSSNEKIFVGSASAPLKVDPPPPTPPAPPEPTKTEYLRQQGQPLPALPDLIPFDRYFDAKSPVLLKGRVRKVESFEGHAALMIEEIESTTPGYVRVPHSDVKIIWRAVLGRLENAESWARDATLVGQTISVRGYKTRGEACELECMMAGRDVYVGKETLPGWLAPRPPPRNPRASPPPI